MYHHDDTGSTKLVVTSLYTGTIEALNPLPYKLRESSSTASLDKFICNFLTIGNEEPSPDTITLKKGAVAIGKEQVSGKKRL